MKIVAVVPNSAVRDARVMKQARYLRAAGHTVEIVGIQEGAGRSYRTITPEEIDVFRAPVLATQQDILDRFQFLTSATWLAAGVLYFAFTAWVAGLVHARTLPTLYGSWDVAEPLVFLALFAMFLYPGYLAYRWFGPRIASAFSPMAREARSSLATRLRLLARRQAMVREIVPLLRELKPDLISCHECMALEACVAAKAELKVPLIYDAHEFYDEVEGTNAEELNRFYRRMHERLLPSVDGFVTVSRTILDCYQAAYPAMTKHVTILPNSVPAQPLPPYDNRLHDAAKLPRGQKILLYQGGMSTFRKVDEIVMSGADLPADWSVVLMGGGADRKQFEDMAASVNAKNLADAAVLEFTEAQSAEFIKRTLDHLDGLEAEKLAPGTQQAGRETEGLLVRLLSPPRATERRLSVGGFVEDRYTQVITNFNRAFGQRISRKRKESLVEQLDERTGALFDQADEIVKVKVNVRSKQWELARRLALQDMLATHEFDVVRRVAVIDPVPQEDLLLWTQGATVGIIPYPITTANHWGCAPNKLWEYPAAGVPVIATPSKEIFFAIRQFGMGWTISADPTAAEIARLVGLLSHDEIVAAKTGCRRFIDASNWQLHARPWADMIEAFGPR